VNRKLTVVGMHRTGHQIPSPPSATSHGLLQLVFAHPEEAIRRARAVLADSPAPLDASIAHQAIGIVQRDFGDLTWAITELSRLSRMVATRPGHGHSDAEPG
jgi:hypothetical protein